MNPQYLKDYRYKYNRMRRILLLLEKWYDILDEEMWKAAFDNNETLLNQLIEKKRPLEDYTLVELRRMGQDIGICYASKFNKADLVHLITKRKKQLGAKSS